MVDTLASGASGGNPVEVRVLFSVPLRKLKTLRKKELGVKSIYNAIYPIHKLRIYFYSF